MKKGLIVFLVCVAALIFTGVSLYGYANGLWNTGVQYEKQLTAQYLSNQNYLGSYVSGFYEQVGLAQAGTEALDKVLLDAVKGRYEKGGLSVNSPLFVAFKEAYPEAGVKELMANWGKIQDYVRAGREGYRAIQDKLLDQLRVYDTWRETGLVQRLVLRTMGVPTANLEARIGTTIVRGEEARNKMYLIVLPSDVLDAYNSGKMDPLKVPKNK